MNVFSYRHSLCQHMLLLVVSAALFLPGCAKDRHEHQSNNPPVAKALDGEEAQAKKGAPDYTEMARQLMAQKHYELALTLLQEALGNDEKKPELHYLSGVCYRETKKPEAASKAFHQSLKLNPDFAPAYDGLGLLSAFDGEWEKAREHFTRAIALNPGEATYQNNLGYLYLYEDDVAAAEACFREALALNPGFALAAINLGVALTRQGREKESFPVFAHVMPRGEAYNNIGVTLEESGKLEQAATYYQRALQENPGIAAAASNLERVNALLREIQKEQEENHP